MGSSAWRAPAARAAAAAVLAAVAASVLVGLGHAEEEPAADGDLPAALPVVASTGEALARTTAPRPTHEAGSATTTTAAPAPSVTRTSERAEAPERIRVAAPRPASGDTAEDTAAPVPATTAAPQPAAKTAAAARTAQPGAGDGGPALVAGTPCTVTARACVDLDARKAWLIDAGTIVRGPVPIQHGDPADPTPRGTFRVEWKAEQYTSREYLTQMPYSVFFAPGGIAFHEGAQDTPSAGCVKLEHDDAEAWFFYLQVGDEVQIH